MRREPERRGTSPWSEAQPSDPASGAKASAGATTFDVPVSSLSTDGRRRRVVPADVRGRFIRARRFVFALLIAIYVALPWIPVGGHPAVFLDVVTRRFYLFGLTFNAQDVWLMTFLLTGGAFSLVVLTALAGRLWCGWACPQTVFIEAFYRPIERLVEGPREKRLRRESHGPSLAVLWRKLVKQGLFAGVSLLLAHVFLAYFVSLPALWAMMQEPPSNHPEAFAVVFGLAGLLWFDLGWFREQFCVVMCPYGRLQSVLLDRDSLIIGYDQARGEPRGKAKREGVGDCVDCKRCVVVCPTGIDIRNGLQLDCIACAQCIDACDEVMDKLGRPRGLVRYDSQRGLTGEKHRFWRGRLGLYAALLAVGALVAGFAFRERAPFEANMLRLAGPPYLLDAGEVRNSFEIHLVNKLPERATFRLEPEAGVEARFVLPVTEVTLESLAQTRAPVFVSVPRDGFTGSFPVRVRVTVVDARGQRLERTAVARFLGPGS